jgi:hypothetical protein
MGKARDIASAAPAPAGVTSTELGYVDGVTSAIQTQINTKSAIADNFTAGKNKIINGDFGINQRGFTSTTTTATYGFDRFSTSFLDGTVTYSAQTFTPGAAPVAGYEGTNFAQIVTTGQTLTTARAQLQQRIESVRTLAGQTATFSFWAKANSGTPNVNVTLAQDFGNGGSPSASVSTAGTVQTITTSWARYSFTISVPSISGKTLGTTTDGFLAANIFVSGGSATNAPTVGVQNNTFQIWGVQVEAGSTATPFQTATGTKQGELAACQRYYYRNTAPGTYAQLGGNGPASTTSIIYMAYNAPVPLRVTPTSVDYGGDLRAYDGVNYITVTSVATSGGINNNPTLQVNSAAGFTTLRPYFLSAQATGNAYIGFSAEL